MSRISRLFLVIPLILLSACAAPLTKQEVSEIKTIGVVNNFPDYPYFTNIGTTVFNNDYDQIDTPDLKSFIGNEVGSLLKAKGFAVKEIANENAPSTDIDLVMVIIPRDIYEMIYTYGYGFYQRSMFGISAYEKSYVALNLDPLKNGTSRCTACYGQSMTDLPIDDLPAKWSDLDKSKQEQFVAILKRDIKNAVAVAFEKTGL